MPRPPDPKSKFPQIIIKASTVEEEKKIRGVKEIVARNSDLTMIDVIEPFLHKHNWPPGNSQTQLSRFGTKPSLTCSRCKKQFPSLRRVEWISGAIAHLCGECYGKDKLKHVIKRELGTI